MSREDLLALTPQAISALSNPGLVKRAQREADAGAAPRLEELADGTVVGTSADGAVARLAPGRGLKDASCTCGASGVCRHRVATALAYPAFAAAHGPAVAQAQAPEEASWSPGTLDDATLARVLPRRELERAEAVRRSGYVAQVQRGTFRADDVPRVALATCTVRFLVPRELSFARCDCSLGGPCAHLALAAWAFREADLRAARAREVDVEVGGAGVHAAAAGALEAARALGRHVLLEGTVHAAAGTAGRFALARARVGTAAMTWVRSVLDDVQDSLAAYEARSARYTPAGLAALLAELAARVTAGGAGTGALPARVVLGTDEAAETRLEHLRLVSLGARVTAQGRERHVELVLADPGAAGLLVLRRAFSPTEGAAPEDGPALARRAGVAGTTLGLLAQGQLVTTGATRLPDRQVVLTTRGLQRTSVAPQTGAWDALPRPLFVADTAELAATLGERPPRFLRPRLRAEQVHAFALGRVLDLGYAPGAQVLRARVEDGAGRPFLLELAHRSAAPGALDALSEALGARPRFVSGEARLEGGTVVVEPLAVACEGARIIVLDLEPARNEPTMRIVEEAPSASPLGAVVREVQGCLAEAAHHGLRHLPPTWQQRRADVEERARAAGLDALGELLERLGVRQAALVATGRAEDEAAVAAAWEAAAVRAAVAAEQLTG